MASNFEVEDILSHVPVEICEDIRDYVSNTVLIQSRYLIVWREKKEQFGFCTHCQKESIYTSLIHGDQALCANCASWCVVKSKGRGRKHLIDDGYFVWFSKSVKDSDSITARGFYVQRNYSEDYENVETAYVMTAVYIFGGGESRMVNRPIWRPNESWDIRKKIFAESLSSMASKNCFLSVESVEKAVADTPFQYSTWEKYIRRLDLLLFFDAAAKYPCVEYLTKLGLSEFVKAKVNGLRTFSAINWRGKTLLSVLKVSKQDLNAIRADGFAIDLVTLRLFQIAKSDGMKISIAGAREISEVLGGEYGFSVFQKIRKFAKLNKISNYVKKQFLRKNTNHYNSGAQVLIAWRDYLSDCVELEMDVKDGSILFPANLHKAHQETIKKIKVKADEVLSAKVRKRLPLLEKFEFESEGMFIRPAADSEELIQEGNALKHCVGRYAEQYAEGKTDLFVIRKISEPDTPFYTLEIRGGRITQVYGLRNRLPKKEVQAFVDAFEAEKLKNKAGKVVAV